MLMKSAAGILLLILMVFIQTPVGHLFKLPALVQHFTKHQALDGVSFIDFLAEHYATDHEDADQPEDDEIPGPVLGKQRLQQEEDKDADDGAFDGADAADHHDEDDEGGGSIDANAGSGGDGTGNGAGGGDGDGGLGGETLAFTEFRNVRDPANPNAIRTILFTPQISSHARIKILANGMNNNVSLSGITVIDEEGVPVSTLKLISGVRRRLTVRLSADYQGPINMQLRKVAGDEG